MVLTGDDLAKHAKLLPRKVIRGLGHMLHQPWYASGNWETVAENLGYGYEEIKHFATMASVKQDFTPGELMLHDWVQQRCGRTLFVLHNALSKADRTDCVDYLEKEIYNCVICTELMVCIKYEDGRSASHLCITTCAQSCLLDSLHTLLEHPIQTNYHLLDAGVSWTGTLAKHFKGRQLMILRKRDGCNMEQDPTVDSSCTDNDISTHNYMAGSNHNPLANSTHNQMVGSTRLSASGTQFASVSGARLKQNSNSRLSHTHVQAMPDTRLQTVSSIRQCLVSDTNLQSFADIQRHIITKANNLNYKDQENRNFERAVVKVRPDPHPVLEFMATESPPDVNVVMSDNSNIEIPHQNDLNSKVSDKSQAFASNLLNGASASNLLNVMDTSVDICKNDFKNGNKKCKDILPLKCEMGTYSGGAVYGGGSSRSSSIEDNIVFNTTDYKSTILNTHMRDDLTEHDDDYKDPSEYLEPGGESGSAFGAEVIGMKESHITVTGPKYPTESSDYCEYKDFDTDEPEREAFNQDDAGSDFELADYQYSSWGIHEGDEPYTCQGETEERNQVGDIFSTSGILSGIDRSCSVNSDLADPTPDDGHGVINSKGFSVSCRMSDDGSSSTESLSVIRLPDTERQDNVSCSDEQYDRASNPKRINRIERTRLYLDFNNYAQESQAKKADDLSGDNIGHVTHRGKSCVNVARYLSEDPEQTFRKPVYESLQRGMSCPTEVVYTESVHILDTPVIAEVFSPVPDKTKLAEFEESGEGSWQTLSSCSSSVTQPVKRHTVTLPLCTQSLNPKRSRHSLPHDKNVRFDDEDLQFSTERASPSLPPRRNLPDIRRSSFTTDVSGQRIPEQPLIEDEDIVPCKIVVAGKSSRPPLDDLLANDKLFDYYREQLNDYRGWCPRETENTIEKTMRDTLSSDGYYILWYMRARKSLVLSVSYQHSLVNYRIHTKVMDMNTNMKFYISPGHYFQHLHELLQYYISHGVRVNVSARYSSQHADRIRLKCPVRVHYGRNQPISV